MGYMSRYREWLVSDYFDEDTRTELESIKNNEEEIKDRFYKELAFGTGGMRGKLGIGSNRINKYTVRKATQGLANYVINYYEDELEKGVVIAYDSRHKSPEFAREVALVLAGNNIKAYLFEELCPVPELSFAVRELNATAGVVITASHNPPEYNGYKVYGQDGGQVVPEKARKIMAEIEEINDFSLIKRVGKDKAEKSGLLEIVGQEINDRYTEEMMKVLPDQELVQEKGGELPIIYTPLHGTGNRPVRRLLNELGFDNLKVVEEQVVPDSDFPTVDSPNPEEFSAFEMALEMAEEEDPDLIIGTDPDCDRMGVVVKDDQGKYIGLNGNQVGVLMADYLLNKLELPPNSVVVKTIVTTEMVRKIAADFGVEVIDVLTGFKYIGEKIKEFEENGDRNFILGFEESYGYLAGTYTRDKDGVIASALTAIMALYYREQGLSLFARLIELYEKYGYYQADLESIYLEGKEGQEKIEGTLNYLREKEIKEIAGKEVVCFKDYLAGKEYDYQKQTEKEIKLPESNVLQYYLDDESLLTIRPSGTEPKLKIYFAVRGEKEATAEEKMEELKTIFQEKIETIIEEI